MSYELQQKIANVIFKGDKSFINDEFLTNRLLLYKDMVRNNLLCAIKEWAPISFSMDSSSLLEKIFNAWLLSDTWQTKYYWRLPLEFALFAYDNFAAENKLLMEILHFECMKSYLLNAPDAEPIVGKSADISPNSTVKLVPCAGLSVYSYAVHEKEYYFLDNPLFLLGFRVKEEIFYETLHYKVAQLLFFLSEGISINESFLKLCALYGQIDERFFKMHLKSFMMKGIIY